MKILKILGVLILILVLLFAGMLVFGPSSGHLERSISIDASAKDVYEEVSNLKSFNQWSPWFQVDPNAEYEWDGPITGVGAKVTWYSEDEDLGNGYMIITEVRQNEFVGMDMKFDQNMNGDFTDEGDEKPYASFILKENGESTLVTWTFDISDVSGFGKMMIIGLETILGPFYEEGLVSLKERVESKPEFQVKISLEEVESYPYLGQEVTTTTVPEDIGKAMADSYGQIMEALINNSIQIQGYPLAVITSYDENNMTMILGIPVEEGTVIDNSDLNVRQSHDGMAIRGIHFGDYSLTENTHLEIGDYAEYYGYELGDPWEVYVTDPAVELDTSKWITEVYYPIK